MALRDQTFKQELREPEASKHPDERMQMSIRHPSLRISAKMVTDPDTGKVGRAMVVLAKASY